MNPACRAASPGTLPAHLFPGGVMRRSLSVLGVPMLVALSGATSAFAASPEIRVLSTRPDLVSGGDALVQVIAPGGTGTVSANSVGGLGALRIKLNGADVTNLFGMSSDGRYMAVLKNL